MNLEDTIAAVSSPVGAGERAIIRLSGPRAVAVADGLFVPASGPPVAAWPTYSAAPGRLCLGRGPQAGRRSDASHAFRRRACPARAGRTDPADGIVIPATAYLMRAPRSYTRQDVVEFHVGAWPALEPMVLEALAAGGVRPAEPGEFTFRAFSAGRLDLAQAEAVMAVVRASSEAALRAAGDLLRGRLSRDLEGLTDRLAGVLGLVEADLDFSDQDLAPAPRAEVAARIEGVRQALADLGRRSRSIETYSGDVRLVLAGWPNVGKSSLFNRLLAADRAIVAPRPGTTRDELRAALHIGEFEFVLSDTAGLQDARDELAGKARRMALQALARADLVLLVLDATAPSYGRTDALLALVAAPMVAAVTKCDLGPPDRARQWLRSRGFGGDIVATSAVTGQGLADLRAALVRAVEGGDVDRQAAQPVVTARHRAAMEQAAAALGRAANLAGSGAGAELVALELREALDALGAIVGRRTPEDILRGIFERFCIGK